MIDAMKPEREMAVQMMQNMGWTPKRGHRGKTPVWEFTRSDTGGLWDAITVRQDELSFGFVAHKAMQYGDAPDLVQTITAAEIAWLHGRFLGIFSRAVAERVLTNPNASAEQRRAAEAEIADIEGERE